MSAETKPLEFFLRDQRGDPDRNYAGGVSITTAQTRAIEQYPETPFAEIRETAERVYAELPSLEGGE